MLTATRQSGWVRNASNNPGRALGGSLCHVTINPLVSDSRWGFGLDFSLSAEQRELREAAAEFARRELDRDLARREEAGEFWPEAWQACAKFGVQGMPVPAELGGGGADMLSTVLVMEGLGYGCHDNGLIFSLNAQMWSLEMPLVKFGSSAQQQAYLPGLVSGDLIGVHAMTEPDSGSDAFSMRTRVEQRGDSYVLNGTKLYITNAPVADVVLVFAAHPGRTSVAGISAFLVDKGTPGFTVSRGLSKMGLRTSPMGEVVLNDCVVPAGESAGTRGRGNGDLQFLDGVGAQLHPGQRGGRDAAPARELRGVRADAEAVRPTDREVPGGGGQGGGYVPAG